MERYNILPADTYIVINKSIINNEDRKILNMLYQPIIGPLPIMLYFSLWSDLDKLELISEEYTHHHLVTNMHLSLNEIVDAREKLEAIGLVKTYYREGTINNYVYELYSPLSVSEFLNHPILNIVLYNNIGKKEYDKLVSFFKVPKINLHEYEDITHSFDEVFTSRAGTIRKEIEDITKRDTSNILINKGVDFNLLISGIPDSQVSKNCFNDETRKLINNLSFIYNLDTLDMQGIVRECINEKGLIDKTLLRKSCRDYYQFDNTGNLPTLIYNKQPDFLKKPEGDNSKWAKLVYTFENITPYQLLKARYKGAEPTDRDKRLIENLMIDQKLNPGVVNVLISYVLQVNDQQLKKSYVETIAGQWKRLNIETVEDAMKLTMKEHKKLKKIIKPKEKKITKTDNTQDLPIWFNKENEVAETSEEDVEELDKILKELV